MRKEQKAAVLIVAQTGRSSMLWGPPGQGKSQFIRTGFSQLGYAVYVLRVNVVLPHHMGGAPYPNSDGTSFMLLPPQWAIDLSKAPKSVLFLDDLSCASPMGQLAALGLMDEKQIGGLTLTNTVTIGAANPNSLATARFDLDAAAARPRSDLPAHHG
jgi:MoxR-like ATPase